MAKQEIITGQKSVWQTQKKTAEGDAGEIYQVVQLNGLHTAYLKRPALSVFRGDIFRQSSQIRNEARIISALNEARGFDERLKVSVPRLLDQSKPGPEYNEGNFIIIEKAEGLDLSLLARVAHKGLSGQEEQALSSTPEGRALLQEIATAGMIPEALMVDILMRLAYYLDFIHHVESKEDGKTAHGIIWNDVKPDHLFWDPARERLTIIDWGNARFLDSEQTTLNRQFSWMDDFRQFFDEMGKFLDENSPDLAKKLGWSDFGKEKNIPAHSIDEIKTRLSALQRQITQTREAGKPDGAGQVSLLLDVEVSEEDMLKIQSQIAGFTGQSDKKAASHSMREVTAFAGALAGEGRLEDLRILSRWAGGLQNGATDYWRVIELLAGIALQAQQERRCDYQEIIESAVRLDWEDVLWRTAELLPPHPFPDWWPELTLALRRLSLGEEQAAVRPLEAVWRIYYTLQALVLNKSGSEEDDLSPEYARQLMNQVAAEVAPNWTLLEPTPPDSRLDYRLALQILTEVVSILPGADGPAAGLTAVFTLPAAQAEVALADWEKKDFDKAARTLRRLLMWDPDRLRVLPAEKAIAVSGDWLAMVQAGPSLDGSFIDWMHDVEFHAIELRSQVGPTSWLDRIVEGCRLLQQGHWPADLMHSRPELLAELPWLASFDRRETIFSVEKDGTRRPPDLEGIRGVREAHIGLNEALALIGPLDTWAPEARGSSARVVSGLLQLDGSAVKAAVKLMRMDQVHYALPLFREEALILSKLADVPGVARMIECGFMKLAEGSEFPIQDGHGHPQAEGDALRIGPDSVDEFLKQIEPRIQTGWTPYLAVEKQDQEENLLFACDAGQALGHYQPTLKLLKMAVQICDVLEAAHARGIVYRDHKILHYYWNDPNNSLTIIDWNVARYHPDGLRASDIEMDIVQFGARGLHHILTGRTAPGALPLGPTRPEEIEAAAHTYKTHWTYDDKRLPRELQEILERLLSGAYTSIPELRADLKKTIINKPTRDIIPAVE